MVNTIKNSIIEIDIENCTGCKACIKECVVNLFYFEADLLQIADTFEDSCILCGHCEAVCPVDVIRLLFHKQEILADISIKEKIPSFDSFSNLALTRRSIRQFKKKAISKDLIEKLLELARYSPTGSNSENVYYTIVQDKEIVTAISNYITKKTIGFVKAIETPQGRTYLKERMSEEEFNLSEENLPTTKRILKSIERGIDFWCWNGELIIIHGDKAIGGIPENCSLAAAHIMLAAETLGLGTCSLGYLTFHINQSKTIRELIKIPEDHLVGYSLTMGYPDVKYKRIPARKTSRIQWL